MGAQSWKKRWGVGFSAISLCLAFAILLRLLLSLFFSYSYSLPFFGNYLLWEPSIVIKTKRGLSPLPQSSYGLESFFKSRFYKTWLENFSKEKPILLKNGSSFLLKVPCNKDKGFYLSKELIKAQLQKAYEDFQQDSVSLLENDIAKADKKIQQLVTLQHHSLDKINSINPEDFPLFQQPLFFKQVERKFGNSYANALVKYLQDLSVLHVIKKGPSRQDFYLSVPLIANNKEIQHLVQLHNKLSADIMHVSCCFKKDSPEILSIKEELEKINQEIDDKIAILIKQQENQIAVEKDIVQTFYHDFLSKTQKTSEKNVLPDKEMRDLVTLKQQDQIKKTLLLSSKLHLQPQDNKGFFAKRAGAFYKYISELLLLLPAILLLYPFYKILTKNKAARLFDDEQQDHLKHIKLGDFLYMIDKKSPKRVVLFGKKAEQAAAYLAMQYAAQGKDLHRKRPILIDLCGTQTEEYLGKHAGITDIMLGLSSVDRAIYREHNLSVDFLGKGEAPCFFVEKDFDKFEKIFAELEKLYSILIVAVAEEPFAPLNRFIKNETLLAVLDAAFNEQEKMHWIDRLEDAGFHKMFVYQPDN